MHAFDGSLYGRCAGFRRSVNTGTCRGKGPAGLSQSHARSVHYTRKLMGYIFAEQRVLYRHAIEDFPGTLRFLDP